MNEQEFFALLDRYGPTLEMWPKPEFAAATTLLRDSPRVRQGFEQAVEMENLLSSLVPVPKAPGLRTRILDLVSQNSQLSGWIEWLTTGMWKPAIAATVPLLLGFAIGIATTSSNTTVSEAELVFFSSAEIDFLQEFAYDPTN